MSRLSAIFLLFLVSSALYSEERYFGYRGTVPGLIDRSISAAALRSDGRYLFYSTGSSSFQALDMQSMALTMPQAVATNGLIFGLYMSSDTRLVATTEQGVQYFSMQYPFEPKEESTKFQRPPDQPTSVFETCMDSDQQIYFLEKAGANSPNAHIIRKVKGVTQDSALITWASLFDNPSTLTPVGIRCSAKDVFVLASRVQEGVETEFWVRNLAGGKVNLMSADTVGFTRTDFILSDRGDQLFVLFNRKVVTEASKQDARIFIVNSGMGVSLINAGSQGQALASFKDGTGFRHGLFLKQDTASLSAPGVNKFLSAAAEEFVPNVQFKNAGAGFADAGQKTDSFGLSSAKDTYALIFTQSTGAVLLSKAPDLQFVSNPMGQELTATDPVVFNLKSDTILNYEIRIDDELDDRGTNSGLSTTFGRIVKEGQIPANIETPLSISAAEMKVKKNKTYAVTILGKADSDGAQGVMARTGLSFAYDPPPGPVTDFRVGFGDMSAQAKFGIPNDGDIDVVLIHFSYDPADLADDQLTINDRTVETGVNGGTLTSPIQVAKKDWDGSYVIAPIQNGKKIYLRAQLKDTKGQLSVENAEAKGVIPYRTLTIPQAIGSVESCSLQVGTNVSPKMTYLLLLIGFGWVSLRLRKKLGPARLRNRRGGD